jgi:hypothetical protein
MQLKWVQGGHLFLNFIFISALKSGDTQTQGALAREINQREASGGRLVIVGIGFGVLSDIATLQHAGSEADAVEAFAGLEAVASGLHQNDVLRGQFSGGPLEQGFQ